MSQLDTSSAADRVWRSATDELEMVCHLAAQELAPLVESEIELMLLVAADICGRLVRMNITIGSDFSGENNILITPQFHWKDYRIDFCFRHSSNPNQLLFVECDGHDFHERTKEQAERDRSKDRAIQAAGIPILRFTGREIWRDPDRAMIEILKFMVERE